MHETYLEKMAIYCYYNIDDAKGTAEIIEFLSFLLMYQVCEFVFMILVSWLPLLFSV
jgi:hypothetical protein